MLKARGRPTSLASPQAGRSRRWWLLVGALLLLATHPYASGGVEPSVALTAVTTRTAGAVTTVVIETTEPVAYVAAQPDPLSLLIDLRNVSTGQARLSAVSGAVADVALESARADDGTALARVRFLLSSPIKPQVLSKWNAVIVEFGGAARTGLQPAVASLSPRAPEAPVAAARPPAPGPVNVAAARPPAPAPVPVTVQAPPPAGSSPAPTLTKVECETGADGTRVIFSGTGALRARSVEPAKDLPPRLVIDFPGTPFTVPAVTTIGRGPVDRVRVAVNSRTPMVTRAVIDLKYPVSHRVESRNGAVVIVLEAAPGQAAPAGTPAAAPAATPGAMPAAAAVPAPPPPAAPLAPDRPTPAVVKPAPAAVKAAPAPPAPKADAAVRADAGQAAKPAEPAAAAKPFQTDPQRQPGQASAGRDRQYTGHLISFDFQQADLRSVLRTFTDISGLNVVIDPAVPTATVDVSLREVPWDQALEVILRSNRLGYVVEDNVVRIARLEDLAKEEQDRQKLMDAQAQAGQLKVFTRSLSYARASDMATLLKATRVVSSRGTTNVDDRTNTLIINDLPDALVQAEALLTELDRAQPQVEIEARIVQTNHQNARALGVQWGVNGRMNSELGNVSPLNFPSQAGISGRTGVVQGKAVPSGVNLPVENPTSALGISMGTLTGSLNLDVALSAMEKKGQGKILSQPKVMMQNNVEAEMYQGVQIPIQTVSNNTVTVTFKDAALSLKVKPQITAANTIILNVVLENASPDYANKVIGIPPINTQRATTQVLVNDAETMVIGGIMESTETSTKEGVPGLSRLPLLGWLFRRDTTSEDGRELLIFITPRIKRGA